MLYIRKKINACLMGILLCAATFLGAATPDTLNMTEATYKAFAADYIGTIPLTTNEEVAEQALSELPFLSENERTKLALRYLYAENRQLLKAAKKNGFENKIPLTHTTPLLWENLEIFANPYSRPDKTIVGTLKRTETVWGDLELTNMLTALTPDTHILSQRQKTLRFFIENKSLRESLRADLSRIHLHEDSLLSLLLATDTLKSQVTEMQVNAAQGLNIFLPKKWRYHPVIAKLNSEIDYFFSGGEIQRKDRRKASLGSGIATLLTIAFLGTTATFWHKFLWRGENFNGNPATSLMKTLVAIAPFAISALMYGFMRLSAGGARHAIDFSSYLRKRLKSIFYFRSLVKRLRTLVSAHEELAPLRPLIREHDEKISKTLYEVKTLLNKSNLQNPGLKKKVDGFMFAALVKTLSLGRTVISGCKLVGTIDAYLSMATLYDEHADKPATFSFVNFTKSTKRPELTLKNFWHPSLNPDTVVLNDIQMGGTHRMKDMILTGPNTAGKSCILKSAALSILLGQTFGIAPAEKATMTPFSHLNTYANLSDNLAEGISLFQAEMNRARELLTHIKQMKPGEFSFTVLDEVFTGTEPIPGEAAAYSVGYDLAHLTQSMTIIATHFPGIPLLEEATNGIMANKRVYVVEHDDGTIERPFKMIDGVNTQQIALELMMHHDFSPELIKAAHRVITHPEEYK